MKPASPFTLIRWVVSLLAALAAIFLRTAAFFNPHTTLDEISLTAALALGAGLLCFLVFPKVITAECKISRFCPKSGDFGLRVITTKETTHRVLREGSQRKAKQLLCVPS